MISHHQPAVVDSKKMSSLWSMWGVTVIYSLQLCWADARSTMVYDAP